VPVFKAKRLPTFFRKKSEDVHSEGTPACSGDIPEQEADNSEDLGMVRNRSMTSPYLA
jgi:hypothetical protein